MLTFNSMGYIIVYLEQLYNFKNDAKSRIENFLNEEELEIIQISKEHFNTALKNSDEPTEIFNNGKMYDVYKKVESDNNVLFYCICDDNETNLNLAFNKYFDFNTNNPNSKNPVINFLKNIKLTAIQPEYNNQIFSNKYYTSFKDIFVYYNILKSDIQTPPPKPHFPV